MSDVRPLEAGDSVFLVSWTRRGVESGEYKVSKIDGDRAIIDVPGWCSEVWYHRETLSNHIEVLPWCYRTRQEMNDAWLMVSVFRVFMDRVKFARPSSKTSVDDIAKAAELLGMEFTEEISEIAVKRGGKWEWL